MKSRANEPIALTIIDFGWQYKCMIVADKTTPEDLKKMLDEMNREKNK